MGKDRMVYTIKNVSATCILGIEQWNQVYKPGSIRKDTTSKSKSNIGNPFYSLGIFRKTEGLVDLQFMQYSSFKGDLKLSVNIPNVYHGNATTPKSNVPNEELERIIHKEIKDVCQTALLPDIREWAVSKDETNIDIIGKCEDIDALFEVLMKTDVPRYTQESTYAKRGSLYYYSGKELKGSNSVIAIYYKNWELEGKYESFNHKGRALQPDECCLRIEIRNRKGPLKTAIKKTKQCFSDLHNSTVSDTVVSQEFQINTINQLSRVFSLDKIFLPKEDLLDVIDRSALTPTLKEGCKRYLEYENGQGNFSKGSYYRYKHLVSALGYAPIYSERRLDINLKNVEELIEGENSFFWKNVPIEMS